MMARLILDTAFVSEWESKYDEIWPDEGKYQGILTATQNQLRCGGSLPIETFEAIRDWKSMRLRGYLVEPFTVYEEALRKALVAPADQKLAILDEPYGIGVPFASTILHFLYPSDFPIIDRRTVAVLVRAELLPKDTISQKTYAQFRCVMQRLTNNRWTLRQVDRALLAYDAIILHPSSRRRRCSS